MMPDLPNPFQRVFLRLRGLASSLLVVTVACSSDPPANDLANDPALVPSSAGGGGASSTSSTTSGEASSGSVSTSGASLGGAGVGGSLGGATTTATSGSVVTGMGGATSGVASTTGDVASGGGTTGGSGAGGSASGGSAGGEGAPGGSSAGGGGGLPGAGGTSSVDQSTLPNVTLHLAGDSTVMTYEAGSAQEGWGQELGQFFIDKVSIDNQAIGGASVRTFQTGRWTNIMSTLAAGDYVMIQFGTNDSGTVAGRHVDVPDFSVALGEMIDDVESRQATAILVTPSALQEWSGGMEGNTRLGPYADAMRELGPMRGVLVDDLNARSVEFVNMIGQTAAQEIYIDGDKAHFTKTGATTMAEFVAQELDRIDSPLADYLK